MTAKVKAENPRELPDTTEDAAATPTKDMPWKELGLKEDEYAKICEILGRRPTNTAATSHRRSTSLSSSASAPPKK